MVIDEIQLVPELLRPIKVTVDLDPTPGQFLLTGSSRVLALRTLPDALPGRMEAIELWPFSEGEISGEPDLFVDAAFRHGPTIEHSSSLRQRDYLDRIVVGGFPEAVRRTPRRRTVFFDSYLSTLIERDVLQLANIERRGDLLKLLSLLAARTSGLLVPATLAHQSGIPRTTLVRYLSCCRRYSSSKAFQPGRPDKPTEPSACRNWPSSTRGSPAISLARTPLASASREARPDR